MSADKPNALFVCFTYSRQALMVIEVMGGVLWERGRDVALNDFGCKVRG
jgi:hypothetical protein